MIVIRCLRPAPGRKPRVGSRRVKRIYLLNVEAETAKAILVQHPDRTRFVWLARSQITVKDCAVRRQVRVQLPAWLAWREGFEGYEMRSEKRGVK